MNSEIAVGDLFAFKYVVDAIELIAVFYIHSLDDHYVHGILISRCTARKDFRWDRADLRREAIKGNAVQYRRKLNEL